MNNDDKMPRKTISMKKEKIDQLEQLAEKETRTVSQQIVHMLEFYLEYKDKVK